MTVGEMKKFLEGAADTDLINIEAKYLFSLVKPPVEPENTTDAPVETPAEVTK